MTALAKLKDKFPMPTHDIVTPDEILEHMGDQTAQTVAPALPVIGPSTGRPRTHSPAAADSHWGSCPHVGATTIRKRKTTLVRWTAVR
jgi:hypothetical protein